MRKRQRLFCFIERATTNLNKIKWQKFKTKDKMNVAFDSKLNWQIQVQKTITKARSSFHPIQLIGKHFTKQETLQLITSNYYSVFYYNYEIWHLPSIVHNTKSNYYQPQHYH